LNLPAGEPGTEPLSNLPGNAFTDFGAPAYTLTLFPGYSSVITPAVFNAKAGAASGTLATGSAVVTASSAASTENGASAVATGSGKKTATSGASAAAKPTSSTGTGAAASSTSTKASGGEKSMCGNIAMVGLCVCIVIFTMHLKL